MLTRFVRVQLVIFTILSVVGISVMVVHYIKAPTLLGIGRITVRMELPEAGGLYRFANVTYRGIQIGQVIAMDVNREGAVATLSLATDPHVPTNLRAEVRSVSAVGEQYVDLRPRDGSGPYLRDGSVISRADVTVPQQVGPMIGQLSRLVTSIPKDKLAALLDESFAAFNGAGSNLRSLVDSSARLSADLNGTADQAASLIDDAAPFLDTQAQSAQSLKSWSQSLAGVSAQLVTNDAQVRTVLDAAPGTADEVARLLGQLKPTLPVLLANLATISQVAVTYRPSLEQILVLVPPLVSYYQSSAGIQNSTGIPIGDFRIQIGDPPACTVGFLPPSSWRNPAETDTVDTPDGLYCKLPQDSPVAVRGARNLPCMGVPGKYAPTVQECYSDKPFVPLAMRQHALGPYPFDPNLIAQGVPPDSRVTVSDNLFGPVDGTPRPGGVPAAAPAPAAAPSALNTSAPPRGGSVAVAHYDPRTGRFATPEGQISALTDLVSPVPAGDWKRMVLPLSTSSS